MNNGHFLQGKHLNNKEMAHMEMIYNINLHQNQNQDEDNPQYYEYGAHFPYELLYNILQEIQIMQDKQSHKDNRTKDKLPNNLKPIQKPRPKSRNKPITTDNQSSIKQNNESTIPLNLNTTQLVKSIANNTNHSKNIQTTLPHKSNHKDSNKTIYSKIMNLMKENRANFSNQKNKKESSKQNLYQKNEHKTRSAYSTTQQRKKCEEIEKIQQKPKSNSNPPKKNDMNQNRTNSDRTVKTKSKVIKKGNGLNSPEEHKKHSTCCKRNNNSIIKSNQPKPMNITKFKYNPLKKSISGHFNLSTMTVFKPEESKQHKETKTRNLINISTTDDKRNNVNEKGSNYLTYYRKEGHFDKKNSKDNSSLIIASKRRKVHSSDSKALEGLNKRLGIKYYSLDHENKSTSINKTKVVNQSTVEVKANYDIKAYQESSRNNKNNINNKAKLPPRPTNTLTLNHIEPNHKANNETIRKHSSNNKSSRNKQASIIMTTKEIANQRIQNKKNIKQLTVTSR